ncbi:methylamine utilization protein [Massilia sp. P8910]|uniref:methylamine utilization protein n=1 Tax=Massilia antarctica TaxID=2765360 RepID=UPI001E5738B4|nr:methylamine utilization protein [Massilia antarctica]MCE3602524.1 methylamine utilization protein [Massilia antarctica]
MNTLLRLISLTGMAFSSAAASAAALTVQVSDSSGKPLADVVVTAEPDGGAPLPKPLKPAEIEQRGLRFLPLVSVIQTGSRVSFPNNDKVKHHIYSFSPAKKFDQKLYSGVAAMPQVFDKAGIVVLGCNIHDRMLAYIKVVDTPFFAKTDAAGMARIELPAAATYTLTSWHFNMAGGAVEQAVAVKAGDGATAVSVRLTMKPPLPDPDAPGAIY